MGLKNKKNPEIPQFSHYFFITEIQELLEQAQPLGAEALTISFLTI